jgi:hypothetical protein
MSHCGQTLPAIFAVLVQIMSSDPFADSASGASLSTSARLQSVCTDSVPVLQMGSYMYCFRHVVCTTLSFLTLLAVSAGGATFFTVVRVHSRCQLSLSGTRVL